jgi:small subunit ribosomal protein S6
LKKSRGTDILVPVNKYELTVVLDGKAGASSKKKYSEAIEGIVKIFKGKIVKASDWGVNELAYKIGKSTSGFYLFFDLELEGKGVKALIDKLRVDGDVLRYLIIKNG